MRNARKNVRHSNLRERLGGKIAFNGLVKESYEMTTEP